MTQVVRVKVRVRVRVRVSGVEVPQVIRVKVVGC